MTKKLSLKDFEHLSDVLKRNINAKIPDSHWDKVGEMLRLNEIKFEKERKSMIPTWEQMHRPFDL